MRRLTGSGSITALAVKPLLALALALAAVIMAPSAASAAPAQADTAVASSTSTTVNWDTASQSGVDGSFSTNAVFNCGWMSRFPFQIVDFICKVDSGVMRVYIICSNGQRFESAPLPAPGTYNVRLICSAGTRVQTIGWETLVN